MDNQYRNINESTYKNGMLINSIESIFVIRCRYNRPYDAMAHHKFDLSNVIVRTSNVFRIHSRTVMSARNVL